MSTKRPPRKSRPSQNDAPEPDEAVTVDIVSTPPTPDRMAAFDRFWASIREQALDILRN